MCTGTEVEAVERVGANLDHVVTGLGFVEQEPHPDSICICITLVDVGKSNVNKDSSTDCLLGARSGDHIIFNLMIGAPCPW